MEYKPAPLDLQDGQIVRAEMWHCGEQCSCTQPRVMVLSAASEKGWRRIVFMLWEGTFQSEANTAERLEQEAELKAAAEYYGVPVYE